ncbi:hypothetical protein [Burkholderia gladioli]|uniref:hypothetical protein n=1 Tax=Burkholderia gladioli TaxID=28095 RepID=UPI001640025F|nr:hypothetical protein [Burkholderia gladioli]
MSNHHSSARPDSSAAEKPDYQDSAHLGLMNAADLIAKYLLELEGRMRATADSLNRIQAEKGANHG